MASKLRWLYSELHAYADLIDQRPLIFPVLCIMFCVILALLMGLSEERVLTGVILGVVSWVAAALASYALKLLTHSDFPSAHTASAVALTFSATWASLWFLPVAIAMIIFTVDGRVRLHRHTWGETGGGLVVGALCFCLGVIVVVIRLPFR